MISILQRVTQAAVMVDGQTVARIGPGMVVLAAIHATDTVDDLRWMADKLATLRIFRNADKHFDIDIRQSGGSILLVSNFTVAAATRKGRRPSFDAAAPPETGRQLFDQFAQLVRDTGIPTATGQFGADMSVPLTNDGPVTFLLDSRKPEP